MSEFESLDWFAVMTNPRCEDRALRGLVDAGFAAYCPIGLYERRVGKARRREDFTRPLFTRYLFVGLNPSVRRFGAVRRVDGVREFVGIDGKPLEISGQKIEMLRVSEDMGLFDFRQSKQSIALEIGDGVLLVSPPFDGMEATVERVPKTRDEPVVVRCGALKLRISLDGVLRVA